MPIAIRLSVGRGIELVDPCIGEFRHRLLGNEWIRGIIRKEAGDETATEEMATAMQEIFRDMIPDKKFKGPRPTREGRLEFNVNTGGNEHDIDDLSSGEKEILFGYLKTRTRAPKNSVIIVDEPELHLNPRMIAGLPNLYERHIGRALQKSSMARHSFRHVSETRIRIGENAGVPHGYAKGSGVGIQPNEARGH